MKDIKVEEVNAAMRDLESKINDLIHEFESKTGLLPSSIDVGQLIHTVTSNRQSTRVFSGVTVKVELY